MVTATRTLNPLHFEDLEPHRFEDLVRQLAHDFRPWRILEATGRMGRDAGIDIRGVETVWTAIDDEEDGDVGHPSLGEHEWLIQVKRQRVLRPRDLQRIVEIAVPDPERAPYGLIAAAACNVSAESMAVFRTTALARGVVDARLWTNTYLEDALFRPENDHLLFAYFGISINTRTRSRLTSVRWATTVKRKVLSAFDGAKVGHRFHRSVVIRDIADTYYPDPSHLRPFATSRVPPWHPAIVTGIGGSGLIVERFTYEGIVRDGTWDIREESASLNPSFGHGYWDFVDPKRRSRLVGTDRENPERRLIHEKWSLPYERILDVDPFGCDPLPGPHLVCRFDGREGPYERGPFFECQEGVGLKQLDPADRRAWLDGAGPKASVVTLADDREPAHVASIDERSPRRARRSAKLPTRDYPADDS